MSYIKVNVDPEKNEISVENDGFGIPVRFHQEEKDILVPTLIFGSLLAGDNFNDNRKRCAGGRNGYGAKLANIYSTYFCVET